MAIPLYILCFVGLHQSNPQFFFAIIAAGGSIQVLTSVCRFMNLMSLLLYGLLLNDKKNMLDICLTDCHITFSIPLRPAALPIGVLR